MAVEVHKVYNHRSFDIFIKMPWTIYYDDPFWSPPPAEQTADTLLQIPPHNRILLVAVKDNIVVGRIAGMINPQHPEKKGALFGCFESINDTETAKQLLQKLEEWAEKKGYQHLTGPVSYNTNDSIGLLIEGFDLPAQYCMPYNKDYYPHLLDQAGYRKHLDLLAYAWNNQHIIPEKLIRVAQKAVKTKGLIIRALNLNNIVREAYFLSSVHNQTMQNNWGAGKLSVSEAARYLQGYRTFADPDLLLAAEVNGEPAGICLTITDPSSEKASCRVAVMAVVPKFRYKGIAALLMHETAARLIRKGYQEAEISLILENNQMMNRILQKTFNLPVVKRFRVYRKDLR